MRLREVLDLSLESTWVTLRMWALLPILVTAAIMFKLLLLVLGGLPAIMNRVLVYEVIRVKRAMMTIRVSWVSCVRCPFSLIVVPLFMLVLILLKTKARLVLLCALVVISLKVSTSWSSLLFEVSPFTGNRGDFLNGANRNVTLL